MLTLENATTISNNKTKMKLIEFNKRIFVLFYFKRIIPIKSI